MSLWNTQIIERLLGSVVYLQLSFLLFMLSNMPMLLVYHVMQQHCNKRDYVDKVWAVGYSGILFGFMAFECMRMDGRMNVFRFDVPYYMGPFVLLLVISPVVPNASFVGHFAGIIAGFVL